MLGPYGVEELLRLQQEEIARRLARHARPGSDSGILLRARIARLLRNLADRLEPGASPRRRPIPR